MKAVLVLLNQSQVHLPTCSKGNLMTLDCGEGKFSVCSKAPYKEPGTSSAPNMRAPQWVSAKHFKDSVREGHPRVCDQLVHNSLIG